MILVSKCLLGENCKYSGGNNRNEEVLRFLENREYIAVCPEMMGGLSCPRSPSEITCTGEGVQVINNNGEDVTKEFLNGAKRVLEIAKNSGAHTAIFKDGSPSCGVNFVYDGTFSGKKKKGCGITSALLKENKIKVVSESETNNIK